MDPESGPDCSFRISCQLLIPASGEGKLTAEMNFRTKMNDDPDSSGRSFYSFLPRPDEHDLSGGPDYPAPE